MYEYLPELLQFGKINFRRCWFFEYKCCYPRLASMVVAEKQAGILKDFGRQTTSPESNGVGKV